jgi:YVTN family beta-propeller protein
MNAKALSLLIPALALSTLAPLGVSQSGAFDNLKGRWVNYEVGTMNAFEFAPGSSDVYTFNQPGARIQRFRASNLSVVWETPVGPGTASIALRPGTDELWVVDRVTSTVSVLDTQSGVVERTLQVAAEPHMLAFTPDGERAYVTCAGSGVVDVIDVPSFSVAKSITIFSREPRGVVVLGDHVFVTPLLSGNGSAPRGNPATGDANDIVDMQIPGPAIGTRALPDRDLYAIKITGQASSDGLDLDYTTKGLGTILYNLRVRPNTSELWIPHTEALNVQFKGEKAFVGGRVSANRLAIVDAAQLGQGQNQRAVTLIDLDALIPTDKRCSTPTDVAFTSDGSLAFVSGYGSDHVAVLSVQATGVSWLGSIRVRPIAGYPDGAGPRSLAITPDDETLLIHNKGENGLARVALADLPSTPGFTYVTPVAASRTLGWDPLPPDINQGRVHFNRTQNSLSNTSSCMTCHVDGFLDGVAWDLSAYLDPEGSAPSAMAFPVDNKGPLVTQSVRRLKEVGPYHWRGEKKSLMQFNDSFVTLLDRQENGAPQHLGLTFRYITQYMEHLGMAPNPRQPLDRGLTPGQAAGKALFTSRRVLGNLTCSSCHTLPLGTRGEIVDNKTPGLAPTTVVPSLREVARKASPKYDIGGDFGDRTDAGIGYGHAGAYPRLPQFLLNHAPSPGPGLGLDLTQAEAFSLAKYLQVFDTGMAPAAAWQQTATASNYLTFRAGELATVQARAQAGDCDLIYRYGPVQWNGQTRYMSGLYDPSTGDFQQAQAGAPRLSTNELMALAAAGTPVTFTGVPAFMGWSMALDRDNDKLLDLDELLLGTDLENNDTDGDGFHDGYERTWQMNPLAHDSTSPDQVAPSLVGSVSVVYRTTNAIKLEFHADEPVRVLFSYNGGSPVLRAPLKPKQDTDFSIVLSELKPDTVYDIELNMTDLAGNVALPHVVVRTLPLALPSPARVTDLEMTLIQSTGGVSGTDLLARTTFELDPGAPAVNYALHARAYYSSNDDSVQVDLGAFGTTTGPAGRASFRFTIPSTITPGQGKVYFLVDEVRAPSGMPVYVEGEDFSMYQELAY